MAADTPTPAQPWNVWSEDLRGGRYWCVRIPGVETLIEIHDDEGGEPLARRIARLPVLEEIAMRAEKEAGR